MYSEFIKYFFIFLISIYIGFKLLNYNSILRSSQLCIGTLSVLLALLEVICFKFVPEFSHLIPLLLLWIFMTYYIQKPALAFIIISLSFGISYCIHAISSFISTFITYILIPESSFFFLIVLILSSLLHIFIYVKLINMKRFKKGLPLSHFNNYINIAAILCVLFISLPIYSPAHDDAFGKRFLSLFLIVFLLAFLIFWWQAQITKAYKHRLLMSELEARRASDPKKDAEIERLSTIIHRINNLINAMFEAVVQGLRTDFKSVEEQNETRERLLANLMKLADECGNISTDYHRKKARTFDTKLPLLDDLLSSMDGKAIEQDITFQVYVGVDLLDYVPTAISESELTHTVDDLLKNAFKSTHTCEKRIVQLQFYKLGKHFVVEVSDNGIPFEIRSLVNMGIERLTTYEDGSGIGLMTIWKAKEEYAATYHLEEFEIPNPFTKKISLTFDKKNRYTIRTWRKDEILRISRRADLQVYDDK